MKVLPIMMLSVFSQSAFASYVNSCELTVKLLQDTATRTIYINRDDKGEVEETQPPIIHGIVKRAKASGRADSGCKHYIGQTIEKLLTQNYNRLSLKKDQIIKIEIMIKSNEGTPQFEAVTYLDSSN